MSQLASFSRIMHWSLFKLRYSRAKEFIEEKTFDMSISAIAPLPERVRNIVEMPDEMTTQMAK